MPARPMGPPCNSQFCKKSKFRQCNDICETMQVELFNYFWLDLKSWELRKQYVSTLVDKIPIKQKGAQSNSRRTCRPTYNCNLQCSRVKNQVCAEMFADTLVCQQETSVTGFLPLLVITHLLQLLLQKQFSQILQRLLQKQLFLKANLLKYLTIKCQKNVKNSQQDSSNHLHQLNLIIVV